MVLPQSQDFSLLLQVFYQGLIKNLISIDEVISWADDVITHTNEPDYFLIEISLSHNKNDLIEAINKNLKEAESPVATRVLIGLIRKKFFADGDVPTEDIETSIHILSNLRFDSLTIFEINNIYAFDDYDLYYNRDLAQLHIDVLSFVSMYKFFSLDNYNEWETINIDVEAVLQVEEVKNDLIIKSFYESKQLKQQQQLKDNNKKELYKTLALIAIGGGSILTIYLTIQVVINYTKTNAHHEYIVWILTLVWMIGRLKMSFFK